MIVGHGVSLVVLGRCADELRALPRLWKALLVSRPTRGVSSACASSGVLLPERAPRQRERSVRVLATIPPVQARPRLLAGPHRRLAVALENRFEQKTRPPASCSAFAGSYLPCVPARLEDLGSSARKLREPLARACSSLRCDRSRPAGECHTPADSMGSPAAATPLQATASASVGSPEAMYVLAARRRSGVESSSLGGVSVETAACVGRPPGGRDAVAARPRSRAIQGPWVELRALRSRRARAPRCRPASWLVAQSRTCTGKARTRWSASRTSSCLAGRVDIGLREQLASTEHEARTGISRLQL